MAVSYSLSTQPLTADETDTHVCVANCHLFWNPKVPSIKSMQALYFLQRIQEEMARYSKENNVEVSLVVCGDFNTSPNSAVYELMSKKKVAHTHPDVGTLGFSIDFAHNLELQSAYSSLGEPATNFAQDYTGCLDYIWYDRHFEVLSVLENPLVSDNPELKASLCNPDYRSLLPNPHYPSDHISIMSELVFK